jgi:DDE superfamily endonuclease
MPPEGNAAFVAAMEDVLKVYERPYDVRYPVVCMDEASRQLIEDTKAPFIDAKGVKHSDYEYIRHGQQSIFLATEPLGKWRTTRVTDRRTAVDWAHFMKECVIDHYPEAMKIILVMDNLNTHKVASFYEAYPPEEASRLADRLEVHYTPKHGSWLDMAETELSALQNQCLKKRRIPTKAQLTSEVKAWEESRNNSQTGVNWQYTTDDARTKLKRLYPVIEV